MLTPHPGQSKTSFGILDNVDNLGGFGLQLLTGRCKKPSPSHGFTWPDESRDLRLVLSWHSHHFPPGLRINHEIHALFLKLNDKCHMIHTYESH